MAESDTWIHHGTLLKQLNIRNTSSSKRPWKSAKRRLSTSYTVKLWSYSPLEISSKKPGMQEPISTHLENLYTTQKHALGKIICLTLKMNMVVKDWLNSPFSKMADKCGELWLSQRKLEDSTIVLVFAKLTAVSEMKSSRRPLDVVMPRSVIWQVSSVALGADKVPSKWLKPLSRNTTTKTLRK